MSFQSAEHNTNIQHTITDLVLQEQIDDPPHLDQVKLTVGLVAALEWTERLLPAILVMHRCLACIVLTAHHVVVRADVVRSDLASELMG